MFFISLLSSLLSVYSIILLVSIILSWVRPDPYGPLRDVIRIVYMLTEPVLEPVRRVLPPAGGLDFSPIIVFFIIRMLQAVLYM